MTAGSKTRNRYKTKPLTERGSLGFNNTVGNLQIDAKHYKDAINSLLLSKELSTVVGRFKYEGLPKEISAELIEVMLYYKGQLAFFKLGGKFYILPFVYTGPVNHYGLQTKIIPIPFNGQIGGDENVASFSGAYKAVVLEESEINMDDPLDDDVNGIAIILRDRSSLMFGATIPTIAMTSEVREKQSENVLLIRNNVISSHTAKYVSVETQDKAASMDAQLSQMFTNILNGKLVESIVGQLRFEEVSSNQPSIQVQQLWQNYASLDALRLSSLGIVNNGTFEKRERVLTDEIKGKQVETQLVLKNCLDQRQLWAKLVKTYYPDLNITVSLSDELSPNMDDERYDSRDGIKTKEGYDIDED